MTAGDENGALPEGWALAPVDAAFDSWGGLTPRKAESAFWGGEIPWASSQDIKEPRLTATTHRITEKALAETRLRLCRTGSVLVVVRSGILAHTLPVAITTEPVVINQDLKAFDSGDDTLNEWLAGWLRSQESEILASSRRDGTTVQSVQYPMLKQRVLPVPPPAEQRRVLRRLDEIELRRAAADMHLDAARRAIGQFRSAVLAAACSGRLTADWRDANPADDVDGLLEQVAARHTAAMGRRAKAPVPVSEIELPELPSTWAWVSVDSLSLAVVDGVHKTPTYVDAGIPFITVRNLTAGPGISFDATRFITPADHALFTKRTKPVRGDILISKDGTIGVTRAVRTEREFSIFVSVALVKPVMYELTDYLELALQSPHVQAQMVGVGSGLVHLVLRDLKADGVPLPPLAEQREIVARVNAALTVADRMSKQVQRAATTLERAWRAALAQAFRGDLVPAEAALAAEEGRDFESAEALLTRLAPIAAEKHQRGRRAREVAS